MGINRRRFLAAAGLPALAFGTARAEAAGGAPDDVAAYSYIASGDVDASRLAAIFTSHFYLQL